MNSDDIYNIMDESVDQDNQSIYWGKRFYKLFWGKVKPEAFRIRPVVPYWNISPVEIRGRVQKQAGEKTKISIKMVCPYLRIVIPLAIVAVLLFFINYGLKGELEVFINSSLLLLAGAYLMSNIPFQIQSARNVRQLIEKFEGELTLLK